MMACPTCDHTLARLTRHDDMSFSMCVRCGTVVVDIDNGSRSVYVPKLVERCRAFEATMPPQNPPTVSYRAEWHRLGIHEAINVPADRPE